MKTRPDRTARNAIAATPLFDTLSTAILMSGTPTLICLTRSRVVSGLVGQAAVAMFPLAVCLLPQQYAAGLFGCSAISTAPNELLALDSNTRPAGIANAIAAAPLF